MRRWSRAAVVAVSLLMVVGCSDGGSADGGTDPASQSPGAEADSGSASDPTSDPESAGPDVSDVPDVVATVDGTDLKKDDFVPLLTTQYQQMAMQSQGQPVDEAALRKQTVEGMVATEVLRQKSADKGITVSEKSVTKGLDEAAKAGGMSTKDFLAAMADQGLDEKTVRRQLTIQLGIEKLIKDEFGPFSATGEEIGIAYQEAKTQQEQMGAQGGQGGQMPPLDDVRDQVKQQVISQKETAATQKYAEKLRKKATVTINV